MSFSAGVKEELSRQTGNARHCQIAELAAIISICGHVKISCHDCFSVKIQTENLAVARKFFTLLKKAFKISTEVSVRKNMNAHHNISYSVVVAEHEKALQLLQATRLLNENLEVEEEFSLVHNLIVQKECCRRAFIRGAFLAAGSISDPNRSYHLELVCGSACKAGQLQALINSFDMEAKVVQRKKYFVVYIKEGDQIARLLALMEANVSMMDMENVRILKEMRNSVNRQVNCETANLGKTISASVKQIEDIRFLKQKTGFLNLSDGLEEIAVLRLEYPQATLKELGEMLSPPVGKSGVNHRLRRLSGMAEELRGNEEDYYDKKSNHDSAFQRSGGEAGGDAGTGRKPI